MMATLAVLEPRISYVDPQPAYPGRQDLPLLRSTRQTRMRSFCDGQRFVMLSGARKVLYSASSTSRSIRLLSSRSSNCSFPVEVRNPGSIRDGDIFAAAFPGTQVLPRWHHAAKWE